MENEGYGMGLVRSTSFGRKRVALSNGFMDFEGDVDIMPMTPLKRQCSQNSFFFADKSALENLPQEILIKILCGVEHDDLKRLFFVSKAIREATLIAKQIHFAYSTPRKMLVFRNVEDLGGFDEVEPPNAPKQSRVPHSRLTAKKLADISVSLFADVGKEDWNGGDLFMEMETVI